MAEKHNASPERIDLTSFEFALRCGACHPGGGPLELDREGHRYDAYMRERGYRPGGRNDLDGDYFRARWSSTGVVEADCLICHLPGYRFEERKRQIARGNFRWAATAGAGLAEVRGSALEGERPRVRYRPERFDPYGRVRLRLVREVPRENCLFCHAETDYKKRGASYGSRDDVHARAGLRCVDCHWAGSTAGDPRIAGLERHEIGKGDDPGGFVRDDLDDTVRDCMDCHRSGRHGAPKALHRGLPPRHLRRLACQACHVPRRAVRAVLIQDATLYNPAPEVRPAAKRVWTFYGPDGRPWNFYGDLHRQGVAFQPVFGFEPVRIRYRGKIWPVNRVHSIWVGIRRPGVEGIDMLRMQDALRMWRRHRADPRRCLPQLAEIRDDNGDGVPEVNRPEEIRALLRAVGQFLGQRLRGGRPVLVRDAAFTEDGRHWRPLPRRPWEATPYASVFKYSHDIWPARAALGARGCTECHGFRAPFFDAPVLVDLWDAAGRLRYEPNWRLLGYWRLSVLAGAFCQRVLDPLLWWGMLVAAIAACLWAAARGGALGPAARGGTDRSRSIALLILGLALGGPAPTVMLGRFLSSEALGRLGALHAGAGLVGIALAAWVARRGPREDGWLRAGLAVMGLEALSGVVLLGAEGANLRWLALALHDLVALGGVALAALILLRPLRRSG